LSQRDPRENAEEPAIREDRNWFLIAADEHPEIRLGASLRRCVFDPLQKQRRELGLDAPGFYPDVWLTPEGQEIQQVWDRQHKKLIAAWVRSHHLIEFDWVYEATSHQVSSWATWPDMPAFTLKAGYTSQPFSFPSWFPPESKRAYRERCASAFRSRLDKHIDDVERARDQFLSHRGSLEKHYGWAALHLILGWSWSEIERYNARSGEVGSRQIVSRRCKTLINELHRLTSGEAEFKGLGLTYSSWSETLDR
jgi:hypothetical protein